MHMPGQGTGRRGLGTRRPLDCWQQKGPTQVTEAGGSRWALPSQSTGWLTRKRCCKRQAGRQAGAQQGVDTGGAAYCRHTTSTAALQGTNNTLTCSRARPARLGCTGPRMSCLPTTGCSCRGPAGGRQATCCRPRDNQIHTVIVGDTAACSRSRHRRACDCYTKPQHHMHCWVRFNCSPLSHGVINRLNRQS